MVASSAPLDQYIVEHPDYFFGSSPEEAHINADNLEILFEPLEMCGVRIADSRWRAVWKARHGQAMQFLADDLHLLHHSGDCWHWVSDSYPADTVSLRAITSDNFLVVDIAVITRSSVKWISLRH